MRNARQFHVLLLLLKNVVTIESESITLITKCIGIFIQHPLPCDDDCVSDYVGENVECIKVSSVRLPTFFLT